jgi:hypothetical protein
MIIQRMSVKGYSVNIKFELKRLAGKKAKLIRKITPDNLESLPENNLYVTKTRER